MIKALQTLQRCSDLRKCLVYGVSLELWNIKLEEASDEQFKYHVSG